MDGGAFSPVKLHPVNDNDDDEREALGGETVRPASKIGSHRKTEDSRNQKTCNDLQSSRGGGGGVVTIFHN